MIIERKAGCMIFSVVVLMASWGSTSYASTFQTLRDAREAARTTYYEDGTQSEYSDENMEIDGAVDKRGAAKVRIDSWDQMAIPRENHELIVYIEKEEVRVAGKVYGDTIMSVLSIEDEWTKIQSGFLQGYVKSNRLCYNNEAKKVAEEVCPEQILSNVWNTEILVAADSTSGVVEYMEQRKPYDIISEKQGWIEVQLSKGISGFVKETDIYRVQSMHVGRALINMNDPQRPYLKENMSDQDQRLLAAIIYCEARGEIFEGQVAVGAVVMNRVRSEKFPNSVSEVIYQDGQFEPVLMDRYEKVLEDESQITASCYEAVEVILQGDNNIGDALYFKIGGKGQQIGSHAFY